MLKLMLARLSKRVFLILLITAVVGSIFATLVPRTSAQESIYGGDIVWLANNRIRVTHDDIVGREAVLVGGPQRFEVKNIDVKGNCKTDLIIEITQENYDTVWSNGSPAPTPIERISKQRSSCSTLGGTFPSSTLNFNDSSIRFADEAAAKSQLGANYNEAAASEAIAAENGDSTESDTCEGQGNLSWILCPIIKTLDSVFDFLDEQINVLLEADRNKYTDPGIRNAQRNIRNVALGILLPIALVMVISTAIGMDFISAYTVKRALPRMIAAAIFISLSWYLTVFAIDVTNAVGAGTNGLITSPFQESIGEQCAGGPLDLPCLFGAPGTESAGGVLYSLVSSAIQAIAAVLGLILFLVFFGTTLAGAAAIAFVILLARQIFIIALMLVAPLAILAWIFPGNDKLWKSWWSAFSKLLLMYPLIMALIAVGRIFAFIINETGGAGLDGSIIAPIFKLAAYMLPYAFIPFTFKFAGGVFATFSGMANDRSKGFFDKQRQKRAEKGARMKNYGLFSDRNRVTKGLNSIYGAGSNRRDLARAGGRLARGDASGAAAVIAKGRETGRTNQGLEDFKNDPTVQAHGKDDKFLLALADEELAKTKAAEATAAAEQHTIDANNYEAAGDTARAEASRAKASQSKAEADARNGAIANAQRVPTRRSNSTRLAAVNALAQSGYQFDEGKEGYEQLSNMVDDIVGDDKGARASAMNEAQFHLKNAGRFDLAGINDGAGFDSKAGVDKVDPYTMASRAKPETIKAKGRLMRESLVAAQEAKRTGDTVAYNKHMETAFVHKTELETAMDSATGKNKDTILNEVDTVKGVGDFASWGGSSAGTGVGQAKEKYIRGVSELAPDVGPPAPHQWTKEEVARGYKTVEREQTRADVARTKARGGRRPNPEELED